MIPKLHNFSIFYNYNSFNNSFMYLETHGQEVSIYKQKCMPTFETLALSLTYSMICNITDKMSRFLNVKFLFWNVSDMWSKHNSQC